MVSDQTDTADLVAELRGVTLFQSYDYNLALNNRAADEIERLRAEIASTKNLCEMQDAILNVTFPATGDWPKAGIGQVHSIRRAAFEEASRLATEEEHFALAHAIRALGEKG